MKFVLLLSLALVGFVLANEEVCVGQAEDSFVADPARCEGWYLCRDEIGLSGTCPDDLWFDPANQWCTYPGEFCAVSTCQGVSDGTFVDNPESCGHWFYCSGGEAFPGVCANDLYFDPVNQVCTYPDYVDCGNGQTEPPGPVVDRKPPTVYGKPAHVRVSPVEPRQVA
ncbi:hypothetical protein DMENIID0001_048250 [Sergentomyia squamirostris]